MKKNIYNIGKDSSDVLADCLSRYVFSIEGKENIEGVFLTPYRSNVEEFRVGIVYHGDLLDNVTNASKLPLFEATYKTGYPIEIVPISYDWYMDDSNVDSFIFPVKGMLKSGSIFYDRNFKLAELKNRYASDDTIKAYCDTLVRPAIQYRKTN